MASGDWSIIYPTWGQSLVCEHCLTFTSLANDLPFGHRVSSRKWTRFQLYSLRQPDRNDLIEEHSALAFVVPSTVKKSCPIRWSVSKGPVKVIQRVKIAHSFFTGEVKPRKSLWLGRLLAANLLAIQLLAANLLANICWQLCASKAGLKWLSG